MGTYHVFGKGSVHTEATIFCTNAILEQEIGYVCPGLSKGAAGSHLALGLYGTV